MSTGVASQLSAGASFGSDGSSFAAPAAAGAAGVAGLAAAGRFSSGGRRCIPCAGESNAAMKAATEMQKASMFFFISV